jgi:hypothetical protein
MTAEEGVCQESMNGGIMNNNPRTWYEREADECIGTTGRVVGTGRGPGVEWVEWRGQCGRESGQTAGLSHQYGLGSPASHQHGLPWAGAGALNEYVKGPASGSSPPAIQRAVCSFRMWRLAAGGMRGMRGIGMHWAWNLAQSTWAHGHIGTWAHRHIGTRAR